MEVNGTSKEVNGTGKEVNGTGKEVNGRLWKLIQQMEPNGTIWNLMELNVLHIYIFKVI